MKDSEQQDHVERVLRSLLWRVRPRRLQRHVDRLLREMYQLTESGVSEDQAFAKICPRVAAHVLQQLVHARQAKNQSAARTGTAGWSSATRKLQQLLRHELGSVPDRDSSDFHCDAGLGGLARWLRAAGYDASWWPGIDDDALLQKIPGTAAILLTTDRRLAERGVLQHGVIPSLLVPISLGKHDQFTFCMETLDLPTKHPRCMACGGTLQQVPKLEVRDRIPPRTFLWLDDYYECNRCQKLFWQGTHWQRIAKRLRRVAP